jgi:hypothetical protein
MPMSAKPRRGSFYLLNLEAGDQAATRKFVVLR